MRLVVVLALASGCNVHWSTPGATRASSASPPSTAPPSRPEAAVSKPAPPAKPQRFVVAALGVSLVVPGDVKSEPAKNHDFGDPQIDLFGEASSFYLTVANADKDRYGLDERIRREQGEVAGTYFVDGVARVPVQLDIIRKARAGNGWEFEYSRPQVDQHHERFGTLLGYFSRRVVGGKKLNCFMVTTDEGDIARAAEACASLAPAVTP